MGGAPLKMRPEVMDLAARLDWIFRDAVRTAVYDLAVDLAVQRGWCSAEVDGEPVPTTEDLVRALREPLSMAAVLEHLARSLGIEPPEVVLQALAE